MANYNNGGKNASLTKEQQRARQAKRERIARRKMLAERKNVAVSNMRNRSEILSGYGYGDDIQTSGSGANASAGSRTVDRRFATDLQNMKFCRKPIGFIMSLIFLIAIAFVAIPFVPVSLPSQVNQYTAVFAETEAKKTEKASTDADADAEKEEGDESDETASNADEAEDATEAGSENAGESAETAEDGKKETSSAASGTHYSLADPVYGWISYVMGKINIDVNLGDSPWYNEQISKVENGMEDNLSAILLQAFPAAVILYLIFALTLFIKTFVCWASGDRRIYRHTWIECLIMIILAAVFAFGGFASTVGPTGKMDFGGIVNYFAGLLTGAGGFTVGYGMFIMIGLPLIGLIFSFFLLEKKLRSRDVMQPIIMYDTK